jgi:acetyl esterase/lipase
MEKGPTMPSRQLVDPELVSYLDQRPIIDYSLESLPQIRRALQEMINLALPINSLNSNVVVSEHFVPGLNDAPQVRVLVYTPANATGKLPAILEIHGGGFFKGSAELNDARNRKFAEDVGCIVVAVDYRLAPETPFPGALEDCYAALRWLYLRASDLGADPTRIAICGESAGGTLCAALAHFARDRNEVSLAFQLLIYPALDDRTTAGCEPHPFAGHYVWRFEDNRFAWEAWLGHAIGRQQVSPYAVPGRADNLSGLPPALICVGALDLFVEEDIEYARRLIRAGVPTELHVYPGAYHGFNFVPDARVTKIFERDVTAALCRALHREGGTT